jgi:hypothetical protein
MDGENVSFLFFGILLVLGYGVFVGSGVFVMLVYLWSYFVCGVDRIQVYGRDRKKGLELWVAFCGVIEVVCEILCL